ncbi:MAG: MerR family transcriptional regulator [Firmicutes bacterium]|nr:MerR family transcriptional regulator [Bacillota bacterium]
MEYTVKALARLAGISPRTLRYYDEIGLLRPARVNAAGHRLYGREEVDKLQQILFYRELGLNLDRIARIVNDPAFDVLQALRKHLHDLLAKKRHLEKIIATVEKTIRAQEGGLEMSDEEKFAAFKDKLLAENEAKYGREIREKYGEEAVERSNRQFRNMSQEDYERFKNLEQEVKNTLAEAVKTGDPAGPSAQKAAALHKEWLTCAWGHYSPEAHAGIVQMYVDDPRFAAYYDAIRPGAAAFLRDAVLVFTGRKQ